MERRQAVWNPWHGCHKISEGCRHCYVYRQDAMFGAGDSSRVVRNADFDLPVRRGRSGRYKIPPGTFVVTCLTSDFFVEEADAWRDEAWAMIRHRSDCMFLIITKRIDRLRESLPDDWGDGYPNVVIGCTCENQERTDYRMPIFLDAPILNKIVICEPLLERIDIGRYLTDAIDCVYVGGESGTDARVCDYEWVLDLRRQCAEAGVGFRFKQTGACFRKDGRLYRIPRNRQHSQAKRAGIDIPSGNDAG